MGLSAVLAAVLITIPSIGMQAEVQPVEQPANLMLVGQFDRLDELNPWDSVVLTTDNGTATSYVVAWSRQYPTGSLPPEVIDGPASGGQVITLITDAPLEEGGYPMQRVVRAVPIP
jgi:hypothetical protein